MRGSVPHPSHNRNGIALTTEEDKLPSRVKPSRTLDCIGLYCPEPVFRTRLELDKMAVGEVLEMLADDPAAEEDIKSLVKRAGHELLELKKEGGVLRFLIRKTR
jgi:TusA-related sulfurtransferase